MSAAAKLRRGRGSASSRLASAWSGNVKSALIRSIADLLALDAPTRSQILSQLSNKEASELYYDWQFWARSDQLPPRRDWLYWLILAGRGAGKTRAGAEAIRSWSKAFSLINLVGPTGDDVRDVMVLGESGLLACCAPSERPVFERSKARLMWPNGSVSQLFSAEEPDRLRGKQHEKLWLDELAAWRYPESFEQALLGLRLGASPQAIITTTPRPIKLIKQLLIDPHAITTRGSTFDNSNMLADAFIRRIATRYAGKQIGQQELFAEIVEDAPGALWTRAMIEQTRADPEMAAPNLVEIVVAVDPPAKSGDKADECGIVVAGKAANGHIYILADLTSQGDSPVQWASRVVAAFERFRANRVVAEVNNGGDMVASILRHEYPNLPVRSVTATRGKYLRAEPVAAAYERGLIHHAATFPELESQLCTLTPDFNSRTSGHSPDRADALVWAVTDLIGFDRVRSSGMLDFYASTSSEGND